ncbi:MAG: hypothetical protein MZW92_55410 [Comamonadaceae bacterium]|nr:hypothetical protein [Comamonadaceae bacterium]
MMRGYWRRPEDTARTLERRLAAHRRPGRDRGRARAHRRPRQGDHRHRAPARRSPPADLEMAIAADPLFEQAWAFGDNRPFIACVVVLGAGPWGQLARSLGLDPQDPASLDHAAAREAALARIRTATASFPHYAQPRAVCLTTEPWTIESTLITPTLKLKRNNLQARFEARSSGCTGAKGPGGGLPRRGDAALGARALPVRRRVPAVAVCRPLRRGARRGRPAVADGAVSGRHCAAHRPEGPGRGTRADGDRRHTGCPHREWKPTLHHLPVGGHRHRRPAVAEALGGSLRRHRHADRGGGARRRSPRRGRAAASARPGRERRRGVSPAAPRRLTGRPDVPQGRHRGAVHRCAAGSGTGPDAPAESSKPSSAGAVPAIGSWQPSADVRDRPGHGCAGAIVRGVPAALVLADHRLRVAEPRPVDDVPERRVLGCAVSSRVGAGGVDRHNETG